MAATVTKGGFTINLTAIDADWTWTDSFPDKGVGGLFVNFIEFVPGALNDIMVIKEGDASGPVCFYANCAASAEPRILQFHGVPMKLFLDFSDCTLNAGHRVIIQLIKRV